MFFHSRLKAWDGPREAQKSILEAWGIHPHPLGTGPLSPGPVGDLVSMLVHRRAITSHLFSHCLHLPYPKKVILHLYFAEKLRL